MKFARSLLLAALVVTGLASSALAVSTEGLVRKVDSFDFLVDYSGSMMLTNQNLKALKIDAAKAVLEKVNNSIPNLGYNGSLHTFAPVSTVLDQGPWAAPAMSQKVASLRNDYSVFGRMTPMGDGLQILGKPYSQMKTPAAVIIVSDGESNVGINPVQEARQLYQSNPGLCFHIISVADSKEGQATLDGIRSLKDCSVMVQAADLLKDQAAVDKFVEEVFYERAMEEAIVLHGVNFAFDSYALDSKAQGILNEVASILKADNKTVVLEGWTDYIGTDAYNKVLSQNRANAVKNYLVKQGVPAANLSAKGMGKSYKYDNATAEGRYLNRRVELLVQ